MHCGMQLTPETYASPASLTARARPVPERARRTSAIWQLRRTGRSGGPRECKIHPVTSVHLVCFHQPSGAWLTGGGLAAGCNRPARSTDEVTQSGTARPEQRKQEEVLLQEEGDGRLALRADNHRSANSRSGSTDPPPLLHLSDSKNLERPIYDVAIKIIGFH